LTYKLRHKKKAKERNKAYEIQKTKRKPPMIPYACGCSHEYARIYIICMKGKKGVKGKKGEEEEKS